jgi:hypothetical protein
VKVEGKWSNAEFEFEEWHESKRHSMWFRTPANVDRLDYINRREISHVNRRYINANH